MPNQRKPKSKSVYKPKSKSVYRPRPRPKYNTELNKLKHITKAKNEAVTYNQLSLREKMLYKLSHNTIDYSLATQQQWEDLQRELHEQALLKSIRNNASIVASDSAQGPES